MNFRNNLYYTDNVRQEENGVFYSIHLNADHFIYKAHFPGEPITPGVCILQIGLELLSDTLKVELDIENVKNVKFLNVMRPDGSTVEVHIHNLIQDEDTAKCQIDFRIGELRIAKMSIKCRKTVK